MEIDMNVVLAESEYPMERGVPESRLGNFVSDVCMIEAEKIYNTSTNKQIDFAFFNNGGLRRALPKGKITKGDVFELMPFENELVVLTLDAIRVKKIFNFIASKEGAPVSGTKFQIKDKEAFNIFIRNKPLDSIQTYHVLTSDYLANGGDSYDFIVEAPRESLNLKVRDALIQYLTKAGVEKKIINVNIDGRISYAR
jgi:2',3'-cyclic-nucleotide 2'-phosphodiesterase (5'-nucleotidase family)